MRNLFHLRTFARRLTAAVAFLAAVSILPVAPGAETWHIALRADGLSGSGTADDPLDGSTPERLAAAFTAVPERRLTVLIGPGVFETRTTLDVKSGWTVRGAGPTRTTLRLANGVLSKGEEGVLVIGRYDYGGAATLQTYACVRDLAVDGNRDGQPAFRWNAPGWIDAIRLFARHGRIENVHVKNTYSRPHEGFPVTIYSMGGTREKPHRAEIYRVWVDRHVGYATSIAAFDQSGGWLTGGIRRCRVTGYGREPSSAAFGAGGWLRFSVTDNLADGMSAGVVVDSHKYEHVLIARNRFTRLWKFGFLMNGPGPYDRIRIVRNRVDLQPRDYGAFLKFDGAPIRCVWVADNVFSGNRYTIPLETQSLAHGVLARNRLPAGRSFRLPPGSHFEVREFSRQRR